MITPWFQRLQEVLKEMGERKTLGKRKGRRNKAEDGEQNKYEIFLPNCGKLTVSRYSFLCFMVSPEYPGRHKLPTNLMVITRIHIYQCKTKDLGKHSNFNFSTEN